MLLSQPVLAQQVQQQEKLTNKQVHQVLAEIPRLLRLQYLYPDKGKRLGAQVRADKERFLGIQSPAALSDSLTRYLRRHSQDNHLFVQYLAPAAHEEADWEATERSRERRTNFGFTKIEIMGPQTAYLKIEEFMHPGRSFPTAVAAMQLVAHASNLIIDLRGNRGGYPGIMEYILNHYFGGPPVLLSKTVFTDGSYTTNFSSDMVAAASREGTPLYIMIDGGTASAAEYFAYTLQAFKKGIVIGEPSAGGAYRNEYFDMPAGFRMSISIAQPVNEVTGGNWEGKGVQPDVSSVQPLATALEMIQQQGSQR